MICTLSNTDESLQGNRFSRLRSVVAILVILIGVGILVVNGLRVMHYFLPNNPDLSSIAKTTGIKFPKNSQLLQSHTNGGMPGELKAKILIPPDSLPSFFASLSSASQVSHKDRVDNLKEIDGPSWWKPESGIKFVSVYTNSPGGFPVNLLLQLDDQHKPILYLHYSR